MPSVEDLIRANYVHRGVQWQPPNSAKLQIVPADPSNYSLLSAGRYRLPRSGKRLYLGDCIHTPEEDADDNAVTPEWFRDPKANASTNAFTADHGDLYAMVPFEFIAWAQGTRRQRWQSADGKWHRPTDRYIVEKKTWPDWFPRDPNQPRDPLWGALDYNVFLFSNEVEGRAATMDKSFEVGGRQWDTLCSWIGWTMFVGGWQGLERIVPHGSLSTWRSDPGPFVIGLFPQIHQEALTYLAQFEAQAEPATAPKPSENTDPAESPSADTLIRIKSGFVRSAELSTEVGKLEHSIGELREELEVVKERVAAGAEGLIGAPKS